MENNSIMSGMDEILESITTVFDGSMDIDGTNFMDSTSESENVTYLLNYLDTFDKVIEDNEVTQLLSDGDLVEHANIIDENIQYSSERIMENAQITMDEELPEYGAQLMIDSNENNTDIVNQIVFSNQQDKITDNILQKTGKENVITDIVKLVPKKSQTQAHKCNNCNYTTGKRYLLSRHMKLHSEERPNKSTVKECDFKTITSLQSHVNTHVKTKPYQCQSCPSAFTTSGELERHLKYKHTHENIHKCTKCDYSCENLDRMRDHMRCHTCQEHQCPHCTYCCSDISNFRRHLRIHTGKNPYECDISFSRCTQSKSVKNYEHSGEKSVFKCDQCPATCGRKSDLQIHIRRLHSDRPIKCTRCGDTLSSHYQLKIHWESHKGQKYYSCGHCPFTTRFPNQLVTHVSIHSNKKLLQCILCNRNFRHRQSLRRHNKLIHDSACIPTTPDKKTQHCNICLKKFKRKENLLRHMDVHSMQESSKNDRNVDVEQRLECTNEDESKKDTSITTSETMEIASFEGENGQQYVAFEGVQLDRDDYKMNNYASTSFSFQQVDQSSNYENNPCLWNPKDINYKDKLAREETTRQIAVSFNSNKGEILRKLHGLRNQHSNETGKKITRIGQGVDEKNKSKLMYFESLKFLSTEGDVGRKTISNLTNTAQLSKKNEELNKDKSNMTLNDISDTSEIIHQPTEQITISNTNHKKRKGVPEDLLGKVYSILSKKEDDIDLFGKFVASELKGLPYDHLRKKAKQQIQQILLNIAKEDDRNLTTTSFVPNPASSSSSASSNSCYSYTKISTFNN